MPHEVLSASFFGDDGILYIALDPPAVPKDLFGEKRRIGSQDRWIQHSKSPMCISYDVRHGDPTVHGYTLVDIHKMTPVT